MTDFREEAYILEKMEISEDEDDDFNYEEIKETDVLDASATAGGDIDYLKDEDDDDDDLNNFEALKAKTQMKALQTKTGGAPTAAELASMRTYKPETKPKVLERDVVIDDFIRNFLQKFGMGKTLNVF